MRYLDLINQFWKLNKEHNFTPNERSVYFTMLNICNELGWKNPFNVSNVRLALECNVTEPTLIKARNVLSQKGLLVFKSGDKKRNNTVYTLKYFSTSGSISDSVSSSVNGSVSDSISGENSLDYIRVLDKIREDKNNKEKVEKEKSFSDETQKDEISIVPRGKEKAPPVASPPPKFKPPTIEQVETWLKENHPTKTGESEKFWNYYESNGWKVGKNKMVSWEKALGGWIARSNDFASKPQSVPPAKKFEPMPNTQEMPVNYCLLHGVPKHTCKICNP